MIYYRISDHSYNKVRLPGSSKLVCFQNFRDIFHDVPLEIIADNCTQTTIDSLGDGPKIHKTEFGNSGSFRYALDLAVSRPPDEIIYFVEDDYLHHPTASIDLIAEGLKISHYVTLYDHKDKYTNHYGYGEVSQVVKTHSSHWRYTISTCMTFATTSRMMSMDRDIWDRYTQDGHPNDHHAFVALRERGRKLGLCIPGKANHCDLGGGIELQEPWAVDMMVNRYLSFIDSQSDPLIQHYRDEILQMGSTPGDILKMLHAVIDNTS